MASDSASRALVTETIAELRAYEPGKPPEEVAREGGVPDAVKLASNENPLGPSPLAEEAVRRAAGSLHRYPDASGYALKQALSTLHGVAPPELVLGNGSNEILELIVRTFCTPRHHIVFAEPSFVVYRMAALAQGIPFTAVPLDLELRHDLPALAAAVQQNTRVVFVANPNNPTGTYVGRAELEAFLEQLPPDVIAVVDEAYLQFADAADFPDSLALRGCRERMITVRTLSKAYGLAALRVGYGVMPPELCDYVNRVRAPFNVNRLAQVAAVAALQDTDYLARTREHTLRERARVTAALTRRGWKVAPSQANFVYVDVARPAQEVYKALLARGVIVRPVGNSTALRISIGLEGENDRMLEALDAILV